MQVSRQVRHDRRPSQRARGDRQAGDHARRRRRAPDDDARGAAGAAERAGAAPLRGVRPPRRGGVRDVPADAQRRVPRRRAPASRAARAATSALVRRQHLDEYDIDYAVLTPMQAQSFGGEAPELAAELCRALNDWIREEWLDRGAAPARLDLPAARAPRPRGARDRAARRRPALRAGPAPRAPRSRGSATGATGRSCAPRPRPACRSRCTRAATRCTAARGGRRTTSRCTSGTATRWRCR